MSLPNEGFDQAVQAARDVERQRALQLFLACIEQDGRNLRAWLWLSRLVDDPADRVTALQNALDLCPPGSELAGRIQAALSQLAQAEPVPPFLPGTLETPPPADQEQSSRPDDPRFTQAIRLITAGNLPEAARILARVVTEEPENERAWLLLSEASADPLGKIRALERALEINPNNTEAAECREKLRPVEKNSLKRGTDLEAQGEFEQAKMVYLSVAAHSRLPAERLEANRRLEDLKERQHIDTFQKVSPTVTLVRLTLGPVLLFMLMVFMQSGLNPLHTPLLAIPGWVSVVAGSLLISVTEMRPAHPRWIQFFGQPGTGEEPEMRSGLRWLGFALLLAPYTMFLIEAGHRLGELQASLIAR